MYCPRCGAPVQGAFCGVCGAPAPAEAAPRTCPRCGAPVTGAYCNACGAPQGGAPAPAYAPPPYPVYAPSYPPPYYYYPPYPTRPPGESLREIGSVFWSFAFLAFLVSALVALSAFLYVSAAMVVPGILAANPTECTNSTGQQIACPGLLYVVSPFWPYIHRVGGYFTGGAFLAYFAFLFSVIVLAYAAHAWDLRRISETLKLPLNDFRGRFETRSSWITVGQLWMATFFLQVILGILLAPEEGPDLGESGPEWYLFFGLGQASVHEELVTRVMFIGIPLALFTLALPRLDPAVPRRRAWLRLLGGGVNRESPKGVILLAGFVLFFSSVVFGLAHVPFWGWWKFPPTFFAGMAMGYLFLRHGLAAAVLFHFVNDYLVGASLLVGSNTGAVMLLGLLFLIVLAAGFVFLILYLVHILELFQHLARRFGLAPKPAPSEGPAYAAAPAYAPASPPPPTPAYAPPPAYAPAVPAGPRPFFACPYCGGTAATYLYGRFQCLTCGQVT